MKGSDICGEDELGKSGRGIRERLRVKGSDMREREREDNKTQGGVR